jgi:U3 small nucleolar RNA-associated protein 25
LKEVRKPYDMPGLALDEDNNTTTRLLTLLNVSALKSPKRKRTDLIEPSTRVKLNRRRSAKLDETDSASVASKGDEGELETSSADATGVGNATAAAEDIENDQGACGLLHRKLHSI